VWGDYLSYQYTFVWRKITFLWSDSKNWGLSPHNPLYSIAYDTGKELETMNEDF